MSDMPKSKFKCEDAAISGKGPCECDCASCDMGRHCKRKDKGCYGV